MSNGENSSWDYERASQIMDEVAALSLIYAGVSHKRLEGGERLQWQVKDHDHPGTPILNVDQFVRGNAKFMPIDHISPAEMPAEEYPILVNTGRVLYHWHGGQMTRRVQGLKEIYGQSLIEINPDDAESISLDGINRIRITSRRGSI